MKAIVMKPLWRHYPSPYSGNQYHQWDDSSSCWTLPAAHSYIFYCLTVSVASCNLHWTRGYGACTGFVSDACFPLLKVFAGSVAMLFFVVQWLRSSLSAIPQPFVWIEVRVVGFPSSRIDGRSGRRLDQHIQCTRSCMM